MQDLPFLRALGEGIKKSREAHCTYKGLKRQFWYLLGCLASKGPEWVLSWSLSGYWAKNMTGDNTWHSF